MALEVGEHFFRTTAEEPFAFSWSIEGEVPRSRGLGSSVTVRLGLLFGLNALVGSPLSRETLFRICSHLEGHPDNAAPATFGGFVASAGVERHARFEVGPELKLVLLVPDVEVLTADARALLPESLSHREALVTATNLSLITAAFASGRYELLRGGFEDFLHQPYRAQLNPGLRAVLEAGTEAGALGGFLSGSGSTLACVDIADQGEVIGAAMRAAHPAPESCQLLVVGADNDGASLLP